MLRRTLIAIVAGAAAALIMMGAPAALADGPIDLEAVLASIGKTSPNQSAADRVAASGEQLSRLFDALNQQAARAGAPNASGSSGSESRPGERFGEALAAAAAVLEGKATSQPAPAPAITLPSLETKTASTAAMELILNASLGGGVLGSGSEPGTTLDAAEALAALGTQASSILSSFAPAPAQQPAGTNNAGLASTAPAGTTAESPLQTAFSELLLEIMAAATTLAPEAATAPITAPLPGPSQLIPAELLPGLALPSGSLTNLIPVQYDPLALLLAPILDALETALKPVLALTPLPQPAPTTLGETAGPSRDATLTAWSSAPFAVALPGYLDPSRRGATPTAAAPALADLPRSEGLGAISQTWPVAVAVDFPAPLRIAGAASLEPGSVDPPALLAIPASPAAGWLAAKPASSSGGEGVRPDVAVEASQAAGSVSQSQAPNPASPLSQSSMLRSTSGSTMERLPMPSVDRPELLFMLATCLLLLILAARASKPTSWRYALLEPPR